MYAVHGMMGTVHIEVGVCKYMGNLFNIQRQLPANEVITELVLKLARASSER